MRTYELHTFANGQWAFDFVFGDSETALEEARRLQKAGKHSAVCVTEENFDEATNVARSRTIYRVGETSAAGRPRHRAPTGNLWPSPSPATPGRSYGRVSSPDRLTISRVLMPIVALAALFFAGVGALLGLQQLM